MKQLSEQFIDGLTFKLTCGGFPEQYDVYTEDSKQVGYLRYRHGYFTIESPNCGDKLLHEEKIDEDGIFSEEDRKRCLELAASLIKKENQMNNSHWLDKNGKGGMSEYFWKYKYPVLLEATGHTKKDIEHLLQNASRTA